MTPPNASKKKSPNRSHAGKSSAAVEDRASRPAHRPLISDEKLRSLYSAMLGCRSMEENPTRKRRKPNLVTPPAAKLVTGLEAIIVGSTFDLRSNDTITAPSGEVILRHRESSRKQARTSPEASPRDVIAFAGASGAQLTIGTGIAFSNKNLQTDHVVISFGDADSQSVASWHEALHLAGLHHLPILFVLRPLPDLASAAQQAALAQISESARIADVIMIPVDATDVVAMYRVAFESIARARNGTGATLIVGTQYRVDGEDPGHTTADPVARMEEYLLRKGLFSNKWKQTLLRQFA